MRKNLNKIVAFAIGVSVIGGSIVPAMAAETNVTYIDLDAIAAAQESQKNTKKILTAEDAAKAAIANSNSIALLDKQIKFQQSLQSVTDKLYDMQDSDNDTDKDYNDTHTKLTIDQLEQKKDFKKDKLAQDTIDDFNKLVEKQIEVNNQKNTIELKEKSLEQNKLQHSLGLMTSINIDGVELEIQKLKNTLKSSEAELENYKYSFKLATNINVDDYTLDDSINYTKFELDGDLDDYIDSAVNNYLSYSQQIYELDKEYWNDDDNSGVVKNTDVSSAKKSQDDAYDDMIKKRQELSAINRDDEAYNSAEAAYISAQATYGNAVINYSNVLKNRINYLTQKYTLDATESNLLDAKKSCKEGLRTVYMNMRNLEDSIDLLQQSIDYTNKNLRLAKVNYDLGLSTELTYKNAVNAAEDSNLQLRKLINTYNTLKENMEKPWIALS